MGNTNGRSNPAPRKLEKGMAVVVMFKSDYPLFTSEMKAGIKPDVWLKGTVDSVVSNKFVFVEINGETLSTIVPGAVIIRSTAKADNLQPSEVKLRMKRAAANQAKRLASKQ